MSSKHCYRQYKIKSIFNTINNLVFSLIPNIDPTSPIIGQTNIDVSPVGFKFVKVLNKSKGIKYDITNIIASSANKFLLVFSQTFTPLNFKY